MDRIYQPLENHDATSAAGKTVWQRLRESTGAAHSPMADELRMRRRAEILAARAKSLRQRVERCRNEDARWTFLAFSKRPERYGILLDEVLAVAALEHFTPVPGAPEFIRGVTPWRGAILSLLDLGKFFGRGETGIADLRACVIVEAAGRRIAVVSHEVEEILSATEAELSPAPDLGDGLDPEWVVGVHDEDRLILKMSAVLEDARMSLRPM